MSKDEQIKQLKEIVIDLRLKIDILRDKRDTYYFEVEYLKAKICELELSYIELIMKSSINGVEI